MKINLGRLMVDQIIDGKLTPTAGWLTESGLTQSDLTDQYVGMAVVIKYRLRLNSDTVAENNRIDIQGDGSFEFIVPDKSTIVDEEISLEFKAPSGEILYTVSADVDVFHPVDVGQNSTKKYELILNPPTQEQIASKASLPPKISFRGRLLDQSGYEKTSGIQVIIWASLSTSSAIEFDQEEFKPIYAGLTDKDGYFFGSYKPRAFGKVFAVVAGSFEDAIELEFSTANGYSLLKLPILLVLSIRDLDLKDDCLLYTSPSPRDRG